MREYNTIEALRRELLDPKTGLHRIRWVKREILRLQKKLKKEEESTLRARR